MNRAKMMAVLMGGKGITYLLRDLFTTAQAAPLTSPRICEPGPGTLTITDAANNGSIAGGELVWAAHAVDNQEVKFVGSAQTRKAGLALLCLEKTTSNTGQWQMGFNSANAVPGITGGGEAGVRSQNPGASIRAQVSGAGTSDLGALVPAKNTQWRLAVILRATGAFYLYNNGQGPWRLFWVSATGNTAALYPYFGNHNLVAAACAGTLDDYKITQLAAPWNSDGWALANIASSGVNQTFTAQPDGIIEFTWVPQANDVLEIDLRRSNADNRMIVRCNQAGNTIKIIQRMSAVETEKHSAAQTWTAGNTFRIVVVADGATIRTYVNSTVKAITGSATLLRENRTVLVSMAGTNLIFWPLRQQIKTAIGGTWTGYERQNICDGDSLTAGGQALSTPYPDQLATAYSDTNRYIYNLGTSGWKLTDMIANATRFDHLAENTGRYLQQVVVGWGGTNDIANGDSAATVEANIQAYCQARRAVGWKVIVGTIIPRGTFDAGQQAIRAAVNAWIIANYASFADGLADFTANAAFDQEADSGNATNYNADTVHLTTTGYGIISTIVKAAIDAL